MNANEVVVHHMMQPTRYEHEYTELLEQRDQLLAAIKDLLFAPATRNERRIIATAQAAIARSEETHLSVKV